MTSLAIAILTVALLAAPQDSARRAEGERLARAGAHAQALAQFQAIAVANPDDVDARLWIARLHGLMGNHRRALDVYRSIVSTNPQNVDALAGAGSELTGLEELDEASDFLSRAEALAADRPSVLAAQGRLHRVAGRLTLALAYYHRALALDASNAEVRDAYDAIRAERAHRVDATYLFEAFDDGDEGLPDTQAGRIEVNARLNDMVRVFGVGQHERFNHHTENRGGAGIEWNAHRHVRIRAGAVFGHDTLYMSRLDAFGEGTIAYRRARFGVTARYFDFDVSDLWVTGARIAYELTPQVEVFADVQRNRVTLQEDLAFSTTSGSVGLDARMTRRLRGHVAYTHGLDRLDWLTIDRLIDDDADTLTVGGRFDVTPFVSFNADYDYQSRPFSVTVHRALGRFTFRF